MNIKNIIREELKAVLNADDQHGSLEQIAGYADDVNNLAKHVLAGEGSLSDAMYDIQTKTLLIKQLVKQPTHTQYIKIKLQERHCQEQKSINLIQILTWTQKLMRKMQSNKHITI